MKKSILVLAVAALFALPTVAKANGFGIGALSYGLNGQNYMTLNVEQDMFGLWGGFGFRNSDTGSASSDVVFAVGTHLRNDLGNNTKGILGISGDVDINNVWTIALYVGIQHYLTSNFLLSASFTPLNYTVGDGAAADVLNIGGNRASNRTGVIVLGGTYFFL